MCVGVNHCVSALWPLMASHLTGIVHNKACSPHKHTHLSPESNDVDTEDRGVFEGQTQKAQGQELRRGRKKVEGRKMINILAYFFQTWGRKPSLTELEMLKVRLRPASRQLWLQHFALYLWLSLPFWCFLPRPPVQSKVGSLFMCKFALRPYEGGAHAESLLSGL